MEWASTSGPDSEPDRPFRMASVGKTFTAATMLRLVETGRIGLDDPIGALLTPDTVALLEGDGYDLAMITVAHLLQHTAGLYDYAFGDGSPFLTDALADRRRVWTRREQLELATSVGAPLWAPGDAFAYSDTGYVLLGEIIEVETGRPYADAMRDLLGFERLGLDHLWLEHGQAAPDDLLPMSRSFFGADEVSDLDFSLDAFGGGGLAGTTSDVARFFAALFDGEVFVDPSSLTTMTTVPPTNAGQEEFGILLGDGGHGVYRMTVAGQECWSHRGFLGTIAMACPDAATAVVVTTNTALTDPLPIATALLELTLAA
jgi:D-alanyl-D-alanine carboxypeptidase